MSSLVLLRALAACCLHAARFAARSFKKGIARDEAYKDSTAHFYGIRHENQHDRVAAEAREGEKCDAGQPIAQPRQPRFLKKAQDDAAFVTVPGRKESLGYEGEEGTSDDCHPKL